MKILSISNVAKFVGTLRARTNFQTGAENAQSVSSSSASEILFQTISSLDLSDAEYGTLLLRAKLRTNKSYSSIYYNDFGNCNAVLWLFDCTMCKYKSLVDLMDGVRK